MQLPKSLTTRTFAAIGFSVFIYAIVALFAGWNAIWREFACFQSWLIVPVLALSLLNYGLRFWRWEIFLRALDIDLPRRESLGLYFATYLMVITPGKIGEVFKAGILRERYGVKLGLGLPIVLAERIFDFLAVLILAVGGVFFWPGPLTGMTTGLVAAALVPVLLLIFQSRQVRTRLVRKVASSPLLSRYHVEMDKSSSTLSTLIGMKLGSLSLGITTVAWLSEGLGLWLICQGLGFVVPPGQAVFIYAAGTLVGSLSFLPGGLGGTEATLIWLLETLHMTRATAATAALLTRLFTLWLAVAVGLAFFLAFRHMFQAQPADGSTAD